MNGNIIVRVNVFRILCVSPAPKDAPTHLQDMDHFSDCFRWSREERRGFSDERLLQFNILVMLG